MSDMHKTATLIMLADEACSRMRTMQKQAAAAVKPTAPLKERTTQVVAALVKAAHIRAEHQAVVSEALTDHAIALDMLEKLAERTVPVSQNMGQEVKSVSSTQSQQRPGSYDGTPAGDAFRAALMHGR